MGGQGGGRGMILVRNGRFGLLRTPDSEKGAYTSLFFAQKLTIWGNCFCPGKSRVRDTNVAILDDASSEVSVVFDHTA